MEPGGPLWEQRPAEPDYSFGSKTETTLPHNQDLRKCDSQCTIKPMGKGNVRKMGDRWVARLECGAGLMVSAHRTWDEAIAWMLGEAIPAMKNLEAALGIR